MNTKFFGNERVRDTVTGFEGAVTAYCYNFQTGLYQYLVEGIDRSGRPVEQWVGEYRLEPVNRESGETT